MNATYHVSVQTRLAAFFSALVMSATVLGATALLATAGAHAEDLPVVALERVVVTAPSVN